MTSKYKSHITDIKGVKKGLPVFYVHRFGSTHGNSNNSGFVNYYGKVESIYCPASMPTSPFCKTTRPHHEFSLQDANVIKNSYNDHGLFTDLKEAIAFCQEIHPNYVYDKDHRDVPAMKADGIDLSFLEPVPTVAELLQKIKHFEGKINIQECTIRNLRHSRDCLQVQRDDLRRELNAEKELTNVLTRANANQAEVIQKHKKRFAGLVDVINS